VRPCGVGKKTQIKPVFLSGVCFFMALYYRRKIVLTHKKFGNSKKWQFLRGARSPLNQKT
jgi:hypothetical protein